jgi:hypothetical protein
MLLFFKLKIYMYNYDKNKKVRSHFNSNYTINKLYKVVWPSFINTLRQENSLVSLAALQTPNL